MKKLRKETKKKKFKYNNDIDDYINSDAPNENEI